MRITIAREAFKREISLLTSKLNIELRKKLIRCYVWSIALCVDYNKIGAEIFGEP